MARQMKDSGVEWIGEIPEEWEIRKLKNVSDINSGEYVSKEDYESQGKFDIIGSNGKIGNINKTNIDRRVIVTGRVGSIGTAHIVQNVWVTDNALIIENKNSVLIKYLAYIVPMFPYKIISTGTAQPLITATILKNQFIPYSNLREQQRITEFLDEKVGEIDSLITKTKETIEDYRKYKRAIITDVVTKGLNPDVEMKATDSEWIGMIPAHWDYVRIQRLFEIVDERNSDSNACLLSLYTSLGVKPRSELEEKGNKAATVMNYKIVKKDDVIVNKLLAWMGAIGYSDYEGVTSPDYDVYRAKENAPVVKTYYNEYFRHTCFKGDCYKYGHGIMLMRWRTYPEDLLRIKVPNPPLDEQKEIAEYLEKKCSEIDKLIAKKEELLADLEGYKNALIYEYVTGKKEV